MSLQAPQTALLVIDVQMEFAIRAEKGVPRTTPNAESTITALLAACRQRDIRVIHIHHHSLDPGSAFGAQLPGSAVQPFAAPQQGESVHIKHVNSGFIGTSLDTELAKHGIKNLLMCGGTANHCVETTTRMAGNLGYNVFYLLDCVWAYGVTGPDGREHSPDTVLSMTLANLHTEFATVTDMTTALAMIA